MQEGEYYAKALVESETVYALNEFAKKDSELNSHLGEEKRQCSL